MAEQKETTDSKQPGRFIRLAMRMVPAPVRKALLASVEQKPATKNRLTGLRNPDKRGQDEWELEHRDFYKEIETLRVRDPLFFRAVDFYDKIALGTGARLQSEDNILLQPGKRFWQLNHMDVLQHQAAIDLAGTANIFAWMPPQIHAGNGSPDGIVPALYLIPMSQIDRIATRDGKVRYYRRVWEDLEFPDMDGEVHFGSGTLRGTAKKKYMDIPAEHMIHIAINRGSGEIRGNSMLGPSVFWAKLYSRSLETAWAIAVARSMFLWHAKIPNAKDTDINEFLTAVESQLVRREDPHGLLYTSVATGQVLATDSQVELNALSSSMSAGSSEPELRRLFLMAIVGPGLPEFMMSDGDYSNLASSLSQSNPFFRLMEAFQDVMVQQFIRQVLRKAYDRYAELGILVNYPIPEGVDHLADALDVLVPDILADDIEKMIYPMVAGYNAGTVPQKKFHEVLGWDPEDMRDELKRDKADGLGPVTRMDPGVPGQSPFSLPAQFAERGWPDPEKAAAAFLAGIDPAVDPAGDPRHAETFALMDKLRGDMTTELRSFADSLKRAKSPGEVNEAKARYLISVWPKFRQLIMETRNMGRATVHADN